MRLSKDELSYAELAQYEVRVDGELIPTLAIIEANEEAFYAVLYKLDSQGLIVHKFRPDAPLGEPTHIAQTEVRYGKVSIAQI